MSTDRRKKYDDEMEEAQSLAMPWRGLKVFSIVVEIRKDLSVPPLTLCAFLQDHAQIIRETFK